MIDTDKYEGLTIDDWYKMNHHDWKDVVNEHNDLLAEVKRLRNGIRSILSDYDITGLIRDVPQDEWNFEQHALVRMKEMIK